MRHLTAYLRDTSGVAAVEAALMTPFLAVITFAGLDASYMMLQNHKMESHLSTAGNYLAKSGDPQSFETRAKRLATTGQIKTGGTPVIAGWTTADITLAYKKVDNTATNDGLSYNGAAKIDVIQLSTAIEYEGFGFLSSFLGNALMLSADYEERLIEGTG